MKQILKRDFQEKNAGPKFRNKINSFVLEKTRSHSKKHYKKIKVNGIGQKSSFRIQMQAAGRRGATTPIHSRERERER